LKKFLCMVVSILLLTCSVFTLAVVDPTDSFYVADYANVLDQNTEAYIVAQNDILYADTGAQICVVTVDFTGSDDIDDYAYKLFNDWGIGSAEKNNGLLLLLSVGADDYYALQGSGLENYLSSGDLGDILYTSLEPDFAGKNYDAGVRKTFDALYKRISSIYGIPSGQSSTTSPPYQNEYYYYDSPEQYEHFDASFSIFGMLSGIIRIFIILVVLIIFISAVAGSSTRRVYRGFSPFYRTYYHRPPMHFHYHTMHRPPFGGPRPPFGGSGNGFSPRPGNFSSHSSNGGFSSRGGAGRSGFSGGRSGGGGSSRGGGAGRR